MDILLLDIRHGLRALVRQPVFTLVAVLLLALGVGATTAVFSVVNAVMIRPLPYQEPARLVAITSLQKSNARISASIVGTDIDAYRQQTHSLSAVAAFTFTELPIRVGQRAFSPTTALVDPEFLPTLGVAPAMGQNFKSMSPPTPDPSVVISDRLWRNAFQADPAAVGQTISVNGDPFTVIGVLPSTFQFPRSDAAYSSEPVDLLLTAASFSGFPKNFRNWFGVGRLASGVSLAQAQTEFSAFAASASVVTGESGFTTRLAPLGEETARASRPALLAVLGISAVLLLIAI